MAEKADVFDLIVVGAGPAGLTAGKKATDLGLKVLIVDSDLQVGGISKTVWKDGFGFDLGGHRFFTKVKSVEDFWGSILDSSDFLDRPRKSRIFYNNNFFDYPLKPFNALFGLGFFETIRCILSYVWVRIKPPKDQTNFEGWVAARFGWRLYNIFFKTYTEKVWGISATKIQSDWAAQRIKSLSLAKAVLNAFGIGNRKEVVTTLIDTFKYPRKGPGMLWEKCSQIIQRDGGVLKLNEKVKSIEFDQTYTVATNVNSYKSSYVISTLPINQLPVVMGCDEPKILEAAEKLKHRDFLIVAIVLDDTNVFDDNWIYIHSPDVKVGRIQNFKSWSPELVREGYACLGLEYFVSEGDSTWEMTDFDLINFAKSELIKLKLVSKDQLRSGYVVKVPKAYPVYDENYQESLELIKSWVNSNLAQFATVGRNGMHRYNNQDHSMLTAMLAVENLFLGKNHDLWSVNVEEEYHEEKTNNSSGRQAPTINN